jgi:uncharacterized protein (TIGR02246 family)
VRGLIAPSNNQGEPIMTTALEIVSEIASRYQAAVSANNSAAYASLFAADAIMLPPGGKPEYGSRAIGEAEQRDYDEAQWTIEVRPIQAMPIDEDWIYGIAETDIKLVNHSDGQARRMTANKGWLIHRDATGEWLIKRAIWNYR